jgi:hypothetical protein
MVIRTGQPFEAHEHLGLAGYGDTTASLLLTTSYQDFVPSPASGNIRRVNEIVLNNEDSAVGTDFYFKLVKASVDYVPVQIFLNAGERLALNFPWVFGNDVKIQAKVGATCVGHAIASYGMFFGGNGILNFTGTSWATLLTAAVNTNILGVMLVNTDTTTQTLSLQMIDGSSNVKGVWNKSLTQGSAWFIDLRMTLPAGYSLQVKQGTAAKTGSAFASHAEV